MITGKNYIGNTPVAKGNSKFKTIDPALNVENNWEFTEVSTEELNEACELAWSAFKIFRNTPRENRANFLEEIAKEIEDLGDELLDIFSKESGLPKGRAINERNRTMFQLTSFAALLRGPDWPKTSIDEAMPDRTPSPRADIRKTFIPIGPIAVFGASNFPLAYSTAGGDTASAFAAGCPVIVKSHPMHAATGEMVSSAIVKAAIKTGMPKGVFANLNSKGIEVGQQLVSNVHIKGVGFTGSISGGRAIYNLANQRDEPIPVFAEMGSINPVILTKGSLENKAKEWAETYAESITLGTGQFCTNPGLILAVDNLGLEDFSSHLAKKIVEINPGMMLHPNIKRSFSENKNQILSNDGVALLSQDIQVEGNVADQAVATVSGEDFISNPNLHHEVFGPFSLIVRCKDDAELLSVIEGLEGQLTGTILAEADEIQGLSDLVDTLQQRVGRIIFNGVPTGVEVCASMNHGGPYPASTDARFTAVGTDSINRWIRPISYQNFPLELLPKELQNG